MRGEARPPSRHSRSDRRLLDRTAFDARFAPREIGRLVNDRPIVIGRIAAFLHDVVSPGLTRAPRQVFARHGFLPTSPPLPRSPCLPMSSAWSLPPFLPTSP